MTFRCKETGALCSGSAYNMSALSEIVVYYPDGSADSMFIRDLDIQLRDGSWKDLREAYKDGDVGSDNYNSHIMWGDQPGCWRIVEGRLEEVTTKHN